MAHHGQSMRIAATELRHIFRIPDQGVRQGLATVQGLDGIETKVGIIGIAEPRMGVRCDRDATFMPDEGEDRIDRVGFKRAGNAKRDPVFPDRDVAAFHARDDQQAKFAGKPLGLVMRKEPVVISDGNGIEPEFFCMFYYQTRAGNSIDGPVGMHMEIYLHTVLLT
jgi:hypothetical protein